jgi:hypothetical protein
MKVLSPRKVSWSSANFLRTGRTPEGKGENNIHITKLGQLLDARIGRKPPMIKGRVREDVVAAVTERFSA